MHTLVTDEYYYSFSLHPTGKNLLLVTIRFIKICDVNSVSLLKEMPSHNDYVNDLAWSSNSQFVAGAGDDGLVTLNDAITGSKREEFGDGEDACLSVLFTPDDKNVLASCGSGNMQSWNATGAYSSKIHIFNLTIYALEDKPCWDQVPWPKL